MSNVNDAFKQLLRVHSRAMVLTRGELDLSNNEIAVTIRVSPSNYSRNLAGPAETSIPGHEFVIGKEELAKITPAWVLKRGDTLRDGDLGELTITEIVVMYGLGGSILGYRVRTS